LGYYIIYTIHFFNCFFLLLRIMFSKHQ